jgi:antitoxin (DNA-binding transcriptional repressor) of toxin-antitoxin stability system
VDVFLRDMAEKVSAVKEGEEALLFTVKDEVTAALIASDSDARKYCFLAGSNKLAVPKKNQRAFRSALKKLGYVIPS